MKKIFYILLAVLLLPFALVYALPRYFWHNKEAFSKLVDLRRQMRSEAVYQANYKYFQKELAKDEN